MVVMLYIFKVCSHGVSELKMIKEAGQKRLYKIKGDF